MTRKRHTHLLRVVFVMVGLKYLASDKAIHQTFALRSQHCGTDMKRWLHCGLGECAVCNFEQSGNVGGQRQNRM